MFETQRASLKEKLVSFKERMESNRSRAMSIAENITNTASKPDPVKEVEFAKAVLGDKYSIQTKESC